MMMKLFHALFVLFPRAFHKPYILTYVLRSPDRAFYAPVRCGYSLMYYNRKDYIQVMSFMSTWRDSGWKGVELHMF